MVPDASLPKREFRVISSHFGVNTRVEPAILGLDGMLKSL